MDEVPWIGFVHVQPRRGTSPFGRGRKGAYTHVLALARNSDEYRKLITQTLADADLIVIEVSDIAPVSEYDSAGRISSVFEELARSLSDIMPVQCDIFDTYGEVDA